MSSVHTKLFRRGEVYSSQNLSAVTMPVGRVTRSSAFSIFLTLYFWLNKEVFLTNDQRSSLCLDVCCFGDVTKSVEMDFSTVSSLDTRLTVHHLGMHMK